MGGRFLCYRTLINHILVGAELAARVGGLAALDVPRLFQLIDCGADGVLAFPVDNSQTGKGVVPILLLSPISIILIQQQNGSKSPVFITFMAQKIPRTAGPQGPAAGGFHLTESVSYFS